MSIQDHNGKAVELMNQVVYKKSYYQHPLKRSFINTPDLQVDVLNAKFEDDHFPTVKYIMVTKVMESKRPYKIRRNKVITRYYGVGVMTTMNQYFYSEIHTRNVFLTNTLVKDFKRLFLTHYIYDKNTKILFSDNISDTNEPISVFLGVVACVKKLRIERADLRQMLKAINVIYQYIRPTKKKEFMFSNRNNKRMINKLFEHKRFEFITDPYWELQLETMGTTERRAHVETAVGILYMFIKEYKRNIMNKYYKKREEKRKALSENKETLSVEYEQNILSV